MSGFLSSQIGTTGARRRRNIERGEWMSVPRRRYCQTDPKISVLISYIDNTERNILKTFKVLFITY